MPSGGHNWHSHHPVPCHQAKARAGDQLLAYCLPIPWRAFSFSGENFRSSIIHVVFRGTTAHLSLAVGPYAIALSGVAQCPYRGRGRGGGKVETESGTYVATDHSPPWRVSIPRCANAAPRPGLLRLIEVAPVTWVLSVLIGPGAHVRSSRACVAPSSRPGAGRNEQRYDKAERGPQPPAATITAGKTRPRRRRDVARCRVRSPSQSTGYVRVTEESPMSTPGSTLGERPRGAVGG